MTSRGKVKAPAVICPDKSSCPQGSTCCPMKTGGYGCCPMNQVRLTLAVNYPCLHCAERTHTTDNYTFLTWSVWWLCQRKLWRIVMVMLLWMDSHEHSVRTFCWPCDNTHRVCEHSVRTFCWPCDNTHRVCEHSVRTFCWPCDNTHRVCEHSVRTFCWPCDNTHRVCEHSVRTFCWPCDNTHRVCVVTWRVAR